MLALIDGDSFLSAAAWGRSPGDAKAHVLLQIKWVVEATFAEDYLIAVGDPRYPNYRSVLYNEYKKSASRIASKVKRPEWFDELRELLTQQPNVVPASCCEADDLIRMWASEASASGDPFVVASIDKDLDCIAGKHYNPRTQELYDVAEDTADFFYWQQLLQGDSVDNIPGLPGIGPVKAKKILNSITKEQTRKELVIQTYKDYYGDEWKDFLTVNGRLIHMWRHEHDYFTI